MTSDRSLAYSLDHIGHLEAHAIQAMREVTARFDRPVLLYSIGKDSSVLVRLAQKAFHPGRIPFPLMHVDTGYKFAEMYEFRDRYVKQIGADLIVWRNEAALEQGANPFDLGTRACCGLLRTEALLTGLRHYDFDVAIGGARRDEAQSGAQARFLSLKAPVAVFPLWNWTELDIWHYIHAERIPVNALYFASEREVVVRQARIVVLDDVVRRDERYGPRDGETVERVLCRLPSLACVPCSGAVRSRADTVEDIVDELMRARG